MAKNTDQQNGLWTPTLIPNFTVRDLLVITALPAIGLAICPLLPTWVDASAVMLSALCFAIGVLYRQFADIALVAILLGLLSTVVVFCSHLG